MTELMTLKMAALAPMQSASVAMAVMAKPLSFHSSFAPNVQFWRGYAYLPI